MTFIYIISFYSKLMLIDNSLILAKSQLIKWRGTVHLNLGGFSFIRIGTFGMFGGGRMPADQDGIPDDCDVNHLGFSRWISRKKCSHLAEKGNEEINSTVDL